MLSRTLILLVSKQSLNQKQHARVAGGSRPARLEIRRRKRPTEALVNALRGELGIMRKRCGEEVVDNHVNGVLVEVVFEDDEARVDVCSEPEDLVELVKGGLVAVPPGMRQSLVSNSSSQTEVQRMGVRPIAIATARIQSSMLPKRGHMVPGVTLMVSLITFMVQPSSATSCSLVKVAMGVRLVENRHRRVKAAH